MVSSYIKQKREYNISERRVIMMNTITQQALKIIDSLDEASQMSVLKFAEFLAAENDDIALYDEAKADDDGYRISSEDLRAKYGL